VIICGISPCNEACLWLCHCACLLSILTLCHYLNLISCLLSDLPVFTCLHCCSACFCASMPVLLICSHIYLATYWHVCPWSCWFQRARLTDSVIISLLANILASLPTNCPACLPSCLLACLQNSLPSPFYSTQAILPAFLPKVCNLLSCQQPTCLHGTLPTC